MTISTVPAAMVARRPSWWFEPVPTARIALFGALIYAGVIVDVLLTSSWVHSHAHLGGDLYRPLQVSRALHLPTPSYPLAVVLELVVLTSAAVALVAGLRSRYARSTATVVAVAYAGWMLLAMSYGKVDHDRYAFLVALFVLPTVARAPRPGTPPRPQPGTRTAAGGYALRCVQLAVVATYFLSAWAKLRFGGLDWPTGAILERALLRRHTVFSGWLIDRPALLVPMQFAMIGVELASPLVLLARTDRSRTFVALGMYLFHLTIFLGVTISFLPHCIAVAAFLPLEKVPSYGHDLDQMLDPNQVTGVARVEPSGMSVCRSGDK